LVIQVELIDESDGSSPHSEQLRHLVALADNRHFGKAAKACFVTQSTLSASLKELEDVLQAPLVDRTNRRVTFTPLGEATVERRAPAARRSAGAGAGRSG